MSKLMDRLKAAGSIKTANILEDSVFFNKKDMITTNIPALNIALSGKIDGGLTSGITFLAGPSRHFKSLFGLIMVKAYLTKYPDAVCLFVDSEFGITPEYIKSVGIDTNRVLHVPIEHIEQLKFDLSKRLEEIERGDRVIVFIDSVGNLASKKEVEDALDGKSAADMTRAKQLKSLFRIITPHFTTKDIPCVVVNHTYMEQTMYPKAIMSGGCVVAGTQITMHDDSLMNVEDIIMGEYVKTMNGPRKVTNTWSPDTLNDGEPECFEIEFEDGSAVICSDEHQFIRDGVWTFAKDLMNDDEVLAV